MSERAATGETDTRRPVASIANTLRAVAIIAGAVLLVWLLSEIVLLVFMAAVLAIILRGIADWSASRTGLPQSLMLAVVTLLIAAMLIGLGYYIGPRLTAQSQDLWNRLQQEIGHLRDAYGQTAWGRAIFQDISPQGQMTNHLASYAGTVATSTLGAVVTGFVLIVTSLYFAIAPSLYVGGIVRLVPISYRPRARTILLDVGQTLQWWSLGQLIDMVVVGVLSGIGLVVLGVPLALALAVLAGLLTFIPYFGAIAAAVPAMLVGLTVSWQTSLWVGVLFVGCHTIEGYLISPVVQRNTAHLPPALTILSMTILGGLFGPLGVILGAPFTAVALVVIREAYVGDVLGDRELTDGTMSNLS